jgi:hypothetical protein
MTFAAAWTLSQQQFEVMNITVVAIRLLDLQTQPFNAMRTL